MTPLITFILQGTLTYPLSIERKNYVHFTVSLKITLFSFERCPPTDKKTVSVKKLKQSQMLRICVSFYD